MPTTATSFYHWVGQSIGTVAHAHSNTPWMQVSMIFPHQLRQQRLTTYQTSRNNYNSHKEPFQLNGTGGNTMRRSVKFRAKCRNSSSADLLFGTNLVLCPSHRVSNLHVTKMWKLNPLSVRSRAKKKWSQTKIKTTCGRKWIYAPSFSWNDSKLLVSFPNWFRRLIYPSSTPLVCYKNWLWVYNMIVDWIPFLALCN